MNLYLSRNAQFGFDPEDLKPKCTSVYDLLEDLIKHFRYLMEDNPSPLQKGVSRPAQVSLTKIKEALSEIQKTGHEVFKLQPFRHIAY